MRLRINHREAASTVLIIGQRERIGNFLSTLFELVDRRKFHLQPTRITTFSKHPEKHGREMASGNRRIQFIPRIVLSLHRHLRYSRARSTTLN